MDANQLIEKNNLWIWKHVHAFARRQFGYGTFRCDEDDLYQECVLYILSRYERENRPDNFRISGIDLFHAMCEYTQSNLPTTHPKTARNYSNVMRNEESCPIAPGFTKGHNTEDEDDRLFEMVIDDFSDTLPDDYRNVLQYIRDGYNLNQISQELHVSRSAMNRKRHFLAKQWNKFTGEQHDYHGGLTT